MNATLAPIDTKTRILDAAERIFSQDGFDGASLRTITAAAQVNLAAVNYHFHTKEALLSAVVERRATPINRRRVELLESIAGKQTPESILDAFLRPLMERSAQELHSFKPLMARLHSAPAELHKRLIEENFAPTFRRFVDALAAALPGASKDDLKLGMFFLVGSMAHTVAWEPVISTFLGTAPGEAKIENLLPRLIGFAAAGMRASATKRAATQATKRVNH